MGFKKWHNHTLQHEVGREHMHKDCLVLGCMMQLSTTIGSQVHKCTAIALVKRISESQHQEGFV